MKIPKVQNGITLVALIITIIVLLILAAVTIGAIKNDGIIDHGKKLKSDSEQVKEIETVKLANLFARELYGKGKLTEKQMQKAINSVAEGEIAQVLDDGDALVIKFYESNRYYILDNNGNVEGPKELVQEEHAGDITKGEECDGSSIKPFKISCIEDLVALSIMTNGGNNSLGLSSNLFKNKYVELTRTLDFNSMFSYNDYTTTIYGDLNTDGKIEDIKTELTKTAEGCVGFTPVNSFEGYFDGQGNELKNIYIKRDGKAGLFIKAKTIKNVGITGKIISMNDDAAGITVSNNQLVENCWNKASIMAGGYRAAGVCSGISSNGIYVKNCYNEGDITCTMNDYGMAAGILVSFGGTIENCYNIGDVLADMYVGGIASGHGNGKTSVKNSYNTGNITSNKSVAGGVLGCNGSIIENCYNTGNIKSNQYAGGLVGRDVAEVKNCYNKGLISANYAGGICFNLKENVVNCYNLGDVIGARVGGIIGLNETSGTIISNCFNIGDLFCSGYDGYSGRNIREKYKRYYNK